MLMTKLIQNVLIYLRQCKLTIKNFGVSINGDDLDKNCNLFYINNIEGKNATILELRASNVHFNAGKYRGMSSTRTMLSIKNYGSIIQLIILNNLCKKHNCM